MLRKKFLKIKRPLGASLEPQEIILDRMVQRRKGNYDSSRQKLERPIYRGGIKFWALLSSLIFLLFLSRVSYFQIAQGKDYRELAIRNQFLAQSIEAERGVIYDRYEQQLVKNVAHFNLVLEKKTFQENQDWEMILEELANFFQVEKNEWKNVLEEDSEEKVILQENISHDSFLPLVSKVSEWPGISIERNLVRDYPWKETLAHLLGYVARTDQKGQAGLEKEYQEILKSNPGLLLIERDSQGKEINSQLKENPSPGKSLILNLDLALQEKIDETLQKTMKEVGSSEANAVAIDPRNGQVLALVSRPSYDNNIFSSSLSSEELEKLINQEDFSFFNAAISGTGYPTGSVIKPLIGLAALEEKIIDPEEELPCPEKICLLNKYTQEETCYHDWKYHGPSNLRRALAESVNTYFYVVGGGQKNFSGLGPEKIKNWLEKFNWGDYTGIDLPEEGKGVLPILDQNWSLGDTYHFSIGQGPFAITPLQVAVAYGAIANGGTLYQPQVVRAIAQETEWGLRIIEEKSPQILASSLASNENLKIIKEGMREAVTSPVGSSHALNSLPEAVASKTGTAQTGQESHYHNWIAVFGPYEEPNLVLVIMLKDVTESMVAWRPAAVEILNWYFSQQDVKLK
jgi:penicillin-binding protein 2